MIAALIEGALVNYLENESNGTGILCCMKNKVTPIENEQQRCLRKPSILHKVSRILFPMAFVLFNVGYWVYFMKGE